MGCRMVRTLKEKNAVPSTDLQLSHEGKLKLKTQPGPRRRGRHGAFLNLSFSQMCRIHGSVDCLSELSSSRLAHSFSGETRLLPKVPLIQVHVKGALASVNAAPPCTTPSTCVFLHAGAIRRSLSTSSAIASLKRSGRSRPVPRCVPNCWNTRPFPLFSCTRSLFFSVDHF